LSAAVRKKILARNPIAEAEKIPSIAKFDHVVLDDAELALLFPGGDGTDLPGSGTGAASPMHLSAGR
jgi:hypothetical protein